MACQTAPANKAFGEREESTPVHASATHRTEPLLSTPCNPPCSGSCRLQAGGAHVHTHTHLAPLVLEPNPPRPMPAEMQQGFFNALTVAVVRAKVHGPLPAAPQTCPSVLQPAVAAAGGQRGQHGGGRGACHCCRGGGRPWLCTSGGPRGLHAPARSTHTLTAAAALPVRARFMPPDVLSGFGFLTLPLTVHFCTVSAAVVAHRGSARGRAKMARRA